MPKKQAEHMNSTLRIISYNIRYNNPADGVNAWPYRKEQVAALLQRYLPDVIGLQEVVKPQLDDLVARLPTWAWVGVGRGDGKCADEFAAIFYRRERFDLLATDTFWLSATPHQPGSFGWDAACVRIATWARLRDKTNGARLLLVNTHFDHRGAQAQLESARLLRRFLNDPAQPMPAIITGDFNCTAASPSYQLLTEPNPAAGLPLLDAMQHTETPHRGPLGTWTTNFADPVSDKIDFIFVWPKPTADGAVTPALTVRHHAILDDQTAGRYPSDHLPVLAEIVT